MGNTHNTKRLGGNITGMTASTDKRLRGRAAVQRRARWLALHPLCVKCMAAGHVTEAHEVDHIVPLFKGGADEPDNLQSLCKPCHEIKTRTDLGWRPQAACDASGLPVDPTHHWNR